MIRTTAFARRRLAVTGALLASAGLLLSGCTQPATSSPDKNSTNRGLVAIGDSLSAGTNSCGKAQACYANSWATGDNAEVTSVASRLGTSKNPLPVQNLAVAGTKLSALGPQLQAALKLKPEYLTVLVGGNDFCTSTVAEMTSASDFEAEFKLLVSTVRQQSPGTELLVPSLLNPASIYAAGANNPKAVAAWQRGEVCQSLLAQPLDQSATAQARRAQVSARAQVFNAALAKVCATYQNCRTDKGALFKLNFTAADISTVDYFHPSLAGQRLIAAAVWRGAGAKG